MPLTTLEHGLRARGSLSIGNDAGTDATSLFNRNSLTFEGAGQEAPDGVMLMFLEADTPALFGVILLEDGTHLLREDSLPWV